MISFICADCGARWGRREPDNATWHMGRCDLCGTEAALTEPRDFGGIYLPPAGKPGRMKRYAIVYRAQEETRKT